MSQKREHRLRKLERQQQDLAYKLAGQALDIEDMRRDLLLLQRRVYEMDIALPPVPWYRRLIWKLKQPKEDHHCNES